MCVYWLSRSFALSCFDNLLNLNCKSTGAQIQILDLVSDVGHVKKKTTKQQQKKNLIFYNMTGACVLFRFSRVSPAQ